MDRYAYRREREGSSNPSFSSTLLDAIYRSIDEGEEELVLYRETMRKKQHGCFKDEEEMAKFQRICMIEKWMEKKDSQKVIVRRRSMADFAPSEGRDQNHRDAFFFKSSSSSSESSSNGGFSSSEAESVHGVTSSSSCYGLQRPKPIRTSVSTHHERSNKNIYRDDYHHGKDYAAQQKPKHEGGGFTKTTKSRALKIYGDLKKVKQPISPGGKLASFLNSLFTAGNAKKAKITSQRGYELDESTSERKSKSANASTCSSASSFSRSCLSKTQSSRGKSSNNNGGMKRSVRFYPVSVIVDEDSQPCGHKNLYEDKPKPKPKPKPSMEVVKGTRTSINEELKLHIMEKNRRVEEAARDLLRNYQKRVELDQHGSRTIHAKSEAFDNNVGDDDEEDDDDAASYASSDLFELDNLSAIGMDQRYREELPVYETTHLDTNRAIANGMIL